VAGLVTGTVRTSGRTVARVASVRELTARLTVRRHSPIRALDSGSGLLADGMTALTVAVRTWTLVPATAEQLDELPGVGPVTTEPPPTVRWGQHAAQPSVVGLVS
jgi:hypothetical protein